MKNNKLLEEIEVINNKVKLLYIIIVVLTALVITIFILLPIEESKTNKETSQEKIEELCIGWANHKVLERKSYSNIFGSNVLQQKYWINVYNQCLIDYGVKQ